MWTANIFGFDSPMEFADLEDDLLDIDVSLQHTPASHTHAGSKEADYGISG